MDWWNGSKETTDLLLLLMQDWFYLGWVESYSRLRQHCSIICQHLESAWRVCRICCSHIPGGEKIWKNIDFGHGQWQDAFLWHCTQDINTNSSAAAMWESFSHSRFCVYLQRNSRINGIARLEKTDVKYQAENVSEWEFDSPALLRLIQDKTVLVIVQEYSCFYVLPIVLWSIEQPPLWKAVPFVFMSYRIDSSVR